MAEGSSKQDKVDDNATSVAEVAYRLMQFVVGVERRNQGGEPKNRHDVLSLYAQCHRVARGEALPPRTRKPVGAKSPDAPEESEES